jgi:hypothetical protein
MRVRSTIRPDDPDPFDAQGDPSVSVNTTGGELGLSMLLHDGDRVVHVQLSLKDCKAVGAVLFSTGVALVNMARTLKG